MNGSSGISFPNHLLENQRRDTRLCHLKLKGVGTS
jgi:hypothetical protein